MREIDASKAARSFGQLVDEVRISREPVMITRYGRAMVLITPVDESHEPGQMREDAAFRQLPADEAR